MVAGVTGPQFSGTGTNTVWPVTNYGVVGATLTVSNATGGSQVSVTFPSNKTLVSFENYTPEVCGFINGQTVWRTNGVFRYGATFREANGAASGVGGSVALPITTGQWSFFAYSNYAAGTFGHALMTNLTARTNAGRDGILWDEISSNNWAWHTNSLIYGATGYTALSQMNEFNAGFPWKLTAITRRHAYASGHIFGAGATNANVFFVGSDGVKVSAFVTSCARRLTGEPYDDFYICFFNADLPALEEFILPGGGAGGCR